MQQYYLAQINIAEAQASIQSAQLQGFVARIEEINNLAEQSPGFIWRLKTEEGNATSIRAFANPDMLINMSVWSDIKSLQAFVYRSVHVELLRQKDSWFSQLGSAHQALWWVPVGHIPTLQEGKQKLALLNSKGPSWEAFTFKELFPAEA